MLLCHSFFILGDLEEQRCRGSVIIGREGDKSQTKGHFMGCHKKTTKGVDHGTTLSRIRYLFQPLGVLHKIPSY